MSRNQQPSGNVSDVGKLIDEEKNSLTDSRADSGFISGGNLELSGEISLEGIVVPEQHHQYSRTSDSGIIEDKDKQSSESSSMYIKSGVCVTSELSLSEKISQLKQLNDLNNPKGVTQQPRVETKNTSFEDALWDSYYQQDEDGDTHLHTAIWHGIPEVALALIRAAPHRSLLDTPNDSAQTPIHLAVETSQPPVVRWLMIAGARPCPRDSQGNSPLHIAARLGDLDCVKAITDPINPKHRDIMALGYPPAQYEKPDLNQWNYIGQTCVHTAAKHGQLEVLKHLVASGADINAREGLDGLTALHYAVFNRDEQMVKYLLTECRNLVPDLRNYAGNNAWQWSLVVPDAIKTIFQLKGVESPYSSEEEDSSSEDDEVSYDNQVHRFTPNLVNASA